MLLEVRGLAVAYGPVQAVRGIDFQVNAGEAVALVGANGAGKSSTLLALSGLLRPTAGRVRLAGDDITGMAPHRIVERGLVQVPEGRAILGTLTVRENLALGAWRRRDGAAVVTDTERVLALFPRLVERLDALAGNLSGGEQQLLAIGRALLARPRLLLLDEPSMGLAPLVVRDIFRTLADIHRDGVALLLVEQNAQQALKLAQRGLVLENGAIALQGDAAALRGDPRVVAAYLGL
jgi:branched-chain amino acid transport system ATP-binding protein